MTAVTDTVAAFEHLVEVAESAADDRPRADLAGMQLRALSTTLGQLAGDDGVPTPVADSLTTVQAYLQERGGGLDRAEGERLRTRVDAYAQVSDDLELDGAHLGDLLARWAAAVDRPLPSSRSEAGPGRRRGAPPATTTEPCPVCGQSFKRVAKHMSAAHPEEWAKAKEA